MPSEKPFFPNTREGIRAELKHVKKNVFGLKVMLIVEVLAVVGLIVYAFLAGL